MQPPESDNTIVYSHSREAMVAHVQRHLKRPKVPSRSTSTYSIILGLCLIALSWPDKILTALFAAVLIIGLPLYFEFWLFPRHAKIAYGEGVDRNPAFLAQRRVRFDESGIEVSVENSTTRDAWTAFEGYDEDETNFYLKVRGRVLPGMLPKRAFRPDQLERFTRLLKQHVRQPPKLS